MEIEITRLHFEETTLREPQPHLRMKFAGTFQWPLTMLAQNQLIALN